MKKQLLVWAAFGIALTGCSNEKSQFEAQFMDGCMGPDGGHEQKVICSCVAEQLEAHHPIGELFALAQQRSDKILQETISYAPNCGAKN